MANPNSYTTSDLVANVQLIAHVPLANATFTAPQVIRLADRELQTSVISQIQSVRGGYYLTYQDYAPVDSNEYAIPSQAISGAITSVEIVQEPTVIQVNPLDQSEQFSTETPTSTSYGYYLRSNTIKILPSSNIGVVRVWFLRRPNALVATSAAGTITSIAGSVVTVSSLPTTLVGATANLCQDQPTFDVLAAPTITDISGLDVTLSAPVSRLVPGDWLCLENQTPVPQIPVEFRPLLEQRVAVKIYELQGNLEKMKAAEAVLEKLEMALFKMISPRVQNQTKVINPQNGGVMNQSGRQASRFFAGKS